MLHFAISHGAGADYQRAVCYGFGDCAELLCRREHMSRTHGGSRLAKCRFVGFHHAQVLETEIAHRACRSSNIQRVPRPHQDHLETLEFAFPTQVSVVRSIWYLVFGIWYLVFGIWYLVLGI